MVTKIRRFLSRNISNIPGWRTKHRIVVFESDDWGSIRMPDKGAYDYLLSKGVRVDHCPYNSYDTLASEEDLSALFDVLKKYKDINGNFPVITANCVVANPDFEKIRANQFMEYHYELFPETLKRYSKHSRSFELWQEGIEAKLFYPQFHGREHLNVKRWMNALRQQMPETMMAFNLNLFGLSNHITSEPRSSYLEAFAIENESDVENINEIISDGLDSFLKLFGYGSRSFIAPNYIWSPLNEKVVFEKGVKYIQGQRKQALPNKTSGKLEWIGHYTGQKNSLGQVYMVRNCVFEPSLHSGFDSVRGCLDQITSAFRWAKPAVISTHRVNFIGGIDVENRHRNLRQFNELLSQILKTWPDVEFLTSCELGDLILSKD